MNDPYRREVMVQYFMQFSCRVYKRKYYSNLLRTVDNGF
jgi:hypothetical protein